MKKNKKYSLPAAILEQLAFSLKTNRPFTYQSAEPVYTLLGPILGYVVKYFRYQEALKRLEQRDLIRIKTGPKIKIRLTTNGLKYLQKQNFKITIKKLARWDGKWRLVIFDVPEDNRKQRNALRHYLHDLGFARIQQSVWAYPYPCENEIAAVAELCQVKEFVSIFTGFYNGDDQGLKKIFGL